MDIDTTPNNESSTIAQSPSKQQPATKSPSKQLATTKSPAKQLPVDLKECFVLLSPCPAFPNTPQNIPSQSDNTHTNADTATQDKPTLNDATSSDQPIAPNPAVAALTDDQEAKPSPKKRVRLTAEEKQAREDAKKAKDEEKKLQAQLREDAKNKKEEEKKQLALAREEDKKKRDEEKRLKDEANKEARLKREAEKKARDDAKLQKDLERKAKEVERLQKLQEKQQQEEEDKRKKARMQERQQAVLTNFVQKAAPVEAPRRPQKVDPDLLIQPYVCGSDFIFPPSYLRDRQPPADFEDALAHKDGDITMETLQAEFTAYMHGRRNRKKKRRVKQLQGLPSTLSNMKFLRFHDNIRPTFYGTFSKRSSVLTGRRPLGTDSLMFDYEVDSDAEWEDEGEGEELSDSEGEKEKEEEESEEEEDKWVVPDGYLSDDEGMDSDDEKSKRAMKHKGSEEGEGADADTASSSSSTKRPADNMDREKTKREKREKKPCIIGTIFDLDSLDSLSAKSILTSLSIRPLVECPIDLNWKPPVENEEQNDARTLKQAVPDSLMPTLILYIHAHPTSLQKIVEGFHSENTQVSKRQLELKIREIAIKTKKSAATKTERTSWQVREDVVKSFSVTLPEVVEVKPVPPKTPQKNVTDFFFKNTANTNSSSNANSNPNPNPPPAKSPSKTPVKTPAKSTSTSSTSSPSPAPAPSLPPTSENGCHTPKRNLMDMFQKQQKTLG